MGFEATGGGEGGRGSYIIYTDQHKTPNKPVGKSYK